MSTMSNIECLYKSLNVNDLTMNECFSTKKYQKIKNHSLYISQSQSLTMNHHMIHYKTR